MRNILGISAFSDDVYNEYTKCRFSGYPFELVGRVAMSAQHLENKLKHVVAQKTNTSADNFVLDKKSINILLDRLHFPPVLASKFRMIAGFRNWVMHVAFLEFDGDYKKEDGSTTDLDHLFLQAISEFNLVGNLDYGRLQQYLKQIRFKHRTVAASITFPEFQLQGYTGSKYSSIARHEDWIKLKIVITKCLTNEIYDHLNDTGMSIFG